MTISILLADDHEILLQGLKTILSSQPDFKVVGQANNGLEAIKLTEDLRPNVLIVDMMMPGLNGLDVTLQVKSRVPDCRVVVLSMYDDESYVVISLQNGASAYVLKASSATDLIQAVRAAAAGQRFLSPALNERAIQAYVSHMENKITGEYTQLTNREREVLHLSAEGLSGPEIARRLTISVRTVETHRANMMHKLNLHSQVELIFYARKQGIIS
jgi:two-component system, NarL family, response regulator NreC